MQTKKPDSVHPWRRDFPLAGYKIPAQVQDETSKHYSRVDAFNGYLRTYRKARRSGDRFARWGFDTPGCF